MNPVDAATTPAELLTSLFELRGQTAVITRGGGPRSQSLFDVLAGVGAHVVTADLDADSALSVAEEIKRRGGKADACRVDVTDEASVIGLFDRVRDTLGGVDVLVNNVEIYPNRPLLEMTVADWQFVQNVNLKGTFSCTR